jgi:hypothetical protein
MVKVKAILSVVTEVAILAKKVKADGKLDMTDTVHVIPFVQKLPEHIKAISDWSEALEEIKKIDLASGIVLVQFVDGEIKKIEKA